MNTCIETNRNIPRSGYCHRCERTTDTVYLPLSSGHVGNCCAVCRATRKGKPFVSRNHLNTTNAATCGHRGTNELSIRQC